MQSTKHILVIDDDPVFRLMLETFLRKNRFETIATGTASETLRVLKKYTFDLILIDLRLPDMDGIELLKKIKKEQASVPLILMTSFVDIRTAVKAIKSGAFEYITKPVNTDELMNSIQLALKSTSSPDPVDTADNTIPFVQGQSKASLELRKNLELVAPTNLSVLVTGESGTGKEFVARMIHQHSKRAAYPFVAVDCGVLSSELAASELFGHTKGAFTGAAYDKTGHFETAEKGTLFLDEIGNLSPDIQVMLLRAIQEKQIRRIGSQKTTDVDVRIIAATNEDLKEAINKGTFREDLYHRLNEFSIYVSPLRERKEEIMDFATMFLTQANRELGKNVKGINSEAEKVLMGYPWPGNLRELKNIIKRSVLLTPDQQWITGDVLPEELGKQAEATQDKENGNFDLKAAATHQEKEYILTVLEKVKYNKSSAARILNIDRKTLYNKLKQYGIDL
ncbi:MAG TPA: sigma-54 dependent transcriptional regulator [Cytophagaceae bacterium]